MTKVEVFEKLNSYKMIKWEVEVIKDQIEVINTTLTNISQNLTDMPRGTGANEYKTEDRLDKLTILRKRLTLKKNQLADRLLMIEAWIEDYLVGMEKVVIFNHYVLGMSMEDISEKIGYCTRQIYRYRDSAVTRISENIKMVI